MVALQLLSVIHPTLHTSHTPHFPHSTLPPTECRLQCLLVPHTRENLVSSSLSRSVKRQYVIHSNFNLSNFLPIKFILYVCVCVYVFVQVNQFACENCRADRDFEQDEFQSIEDSVRRVREQVHWREWDEGDGGGEGGGEGEGVG